MVNREDIGRISELYQQAANYKAALEVLELGPRIVAFVVEGEIVTHNDYDDTDTTTTRMATINAEGIQYPPQMIQAIKAQVEKRLGEIGNELQQLGVKPQS